MDVDSDSLSVVAIMLSTSAMVFTAPWLHVDDVRDGKVAETRRGETIAATIVLTSGFLLSLHSGSKLPLLLGIFLTGIYVSGIEYTVRRNAECT